MSEPALLSLTPERQARLLELLERQGGEALFLREALEICREAFDVDDLAAYVEGAQGLECVARLGEHAFPAVLAEGAGGWPARTLRGGLLVGSDPLAGELPEPLPLLLALGLRLHRQGQSLKQHDFAAKLRGVEREALYDVGLAIASTLDLAAVSEEILLRAVSLLDARRGALYLLDGEHFRLRSTIGGIARETLEHGVEPESADLLPGATHLLAVPVEVEGELRGLLVVGDKESRSGVREFPTEDRRSLALFANQAALALEQARLHEEALEKQRLEREMELAAEIQQGILPRALPDIAGYDLLGWTRPARHVGGDYWDVVPLPQERYALVVADVTGKGVSAALLVSTIHAALRLLLARGESKEALLGALNAHLLDFSAANKFVTLLLVELDPDRARLSCVNAGHNPALLLRAGGEVEQLRAASVPLGLLPAPPPFRTVEAQIGAGDLLCIYSDGVTEAASRAGEEWGLERLEALLRREQRTPLPEIRATLDDELRGWADGMPQGDDQTVVLLRRR